MTDKEKKAEYDRLYRIRNKESIALKKKLYSESEAGRQMQKRQRVKNKISGYHNAFCRKPEQRAKEKINRHKRLGTFGKVKTCLICELEKPILDFQCYLVFPDKRNYLCRDCEQKQELELGIKTKNVIQAMVTRCDYRLSRKDVAKYPYLIEANKYLILLKKLVQ